jgi:hypothetical protein
MMPITLSPSLGFREGPGNSVDSEVQAQVLGLLTAFYPRTEVVERRRDSRHPFPHLVHLTPVGQDGVTPEGESVVVVGKHISERGLGFYHPKPLPYRRMIASVETANGHWIGFLIDLNWCRFMRQGWYESGGRFLQSVLSPMESAAQNAPQRPRRA